MVQGMSNVCRLKLLAALVLAGARRGTAFSLCHTARVRSAAQASSRPSTATSRPSTADLLCLDEAHTRRAKGPRQTPFLAKTNHPTAWSDDAAFAGFLEAS